VAASSLQRLELALMKLMSLGAVEPKGKAQATRYFAVAGQGQTTKLNPLDSR